MPYFKYKEKSVYYEEIGKGEPLILLHGNTASSNMFQSVLDLYKDKYKLILIDFLGHGKSQRIEEFPVDLWFEEGMQVIQLIEQLGYEKVNIIGSSGGALVGLNVALERPELVNLIVADSFEGEHAMKEFIDNLHQQREMSKKDDSVRFYSFCHGSNWEQVVDNDTKAICRHAKEIGAFFHKPLELLETKLLMTCSKEDEFIGNFCEELYSSISKKVPNSQIYLFERGGHPAMLTNPEEFAQIAKEFFSLK